MLPPSDRVRVFTEGPIPHLCLHQHLYLRVRKFARVGPLLSRLRVDLRGVLSRGILRGKWPDVELRSGQMHLTR